MKVILYCAVLLLSPVLASCTRAQSPQSAETNYTRARNAIMHGYYRYLDSLLLSDTTLVTAVDGNGLPLLTLAGFDPTSTEILLTRGADPNFSVDTEFKPLASAVLDGNLTVIRLLIEHGARLHRDDIVQAIQVHNAEVLALLLDQGLNPNFDDKAGSPLMWAAFHGDTACCRVLLQHGADPNYLYRGQETALPNAVHSGSLACVQMLLAAGADPNLGDRKFRPIWGPPSEQILRLLLEHGSDPNVSDYRGQTRLHYDAIHCRWNLIKVLLEFGAKKDIRDSSGKTPLDYAEERGCTQAIELLSK